MTGGRENFRNIFVKEIEFAKNKKKSLKFFFS